MGNPDRHDVRIGTAERQSAVDALGDHFAQGRLDPHEFEERTSAAYGARTAAELDELFRDLPRPPAPPQQRHVPHLPPPMPPPLPVYPHYPVHMPHPDYAPFGRELATGIPYSDKQRVVAGLLQIFLPFGIGRFYTGHTGIAVAQLITTFFFIGIIWSFVDGIVLLASRTVDPYGRPLR